MTKYEILENEDGIKTIKRYNDDESVSFIPADESNSDYQAYLRHLSGEDEAQSL